MRCQWIYCQDDDDDDDEAKATARKQSGRRRRREFTCCSSPEEGRHNLIVNDSYQQPSSAAPSWPTQQVEGARRGSRPVAPATQQVITARAGNLTQVTHESSRSSIRLAAFVAPRAVEPRRGDVGRRLDSLWLYLELSSSHLL